MNSKKSTTSLFQILSNSNSINSFLDQYEADLEPVGFVEYLNKLSLEKNCTVTEIIARGSINESYCYQLFKGTRKPSRDKIIQIAFAMGVNLYEANRLLKAGEKAELYCRDKRDAIIIFGINNRMTLIDVEEVLLDNNLESLTGLSI